MGILFIAFPLDIKCSGNLRLPQWRLEIAATIFVDVKWKCYTHSLKENFKEKIKKILDNKTEFEFIVFMLQLRMFLTGLVLLIFMYSCNMNYRKAVYYGTKAANLH